MYSRSAVVLQPAVHGSCPAPTEHPLCSHAC